jgi:citrate synthase
VIIVSNEPISRIDPEKGMLYFRGLDATELARTRSFEDVTYLLIYGQLPDEKESSTFRMLMLKHRRLLERELPKIIKLIKANPSERPQYAPTGIDRTQMMGMRPLAKRVEYLSKRYNLDLMDSVLAFVALSPVVIAAGWRYLEGERIVPPNDTLGHSHNSLWMLKETMLPPRDQDDLEACFILHMDDPNNPSLSALEKSISEGGSLSDSLVAALDYHIDPLHHGAGEEVMKAMAEMGYSKDVETYLSKAIDSGDRIYGLGHRIYRTIDPRAVVLREILKKRTVDHETYALFNRIEEIARIGPELIRQRKGRIVYPNVDLYNAAVYHTFGIPYYLNTELFAVSRAAGWAAHIAEWMDLV